MTSMTIDFTTKGSGSAKQQANLLVQAAARGDLKRVRERRWDVFWVNGVERPEVRVVVTGLLNGGQLVVADPDADVSLVVPA